MPTQLTKFNCSLTISWIFENVLNPGLGNPKDTVGYSYSDELTDGNADDKAEWLWHKQAILEENGTAGATDSWDLSGSGLVDSFGNTVVATKIKTIILENRGTTGQDIIELGGGSNAFASWLGASGDVIKIGPGGVFLLHNPENAGYAVTAGTGDILQLVNAGSSQEVPYTLILVGTDT